jgi:hypothetical protein
MSQNPASHQTGIRLTGSLSSTDFDILHCNIFIIKINKQKESFGKHCNNNIVQKDVSEYHIIQKATKLEKNKQREHK